MFVYRIHPVNIFSPKTKLNLYSRKEMNTKLFFPSPFLDTGVTGLISSFSKSIELEKW